jgi:hypothetical protein
VPPRTALLGRSKLFEGESTKEQTQIGDEMETYSNTLDTDWVSKLKYAGYTTVFKAGKPPKEFEFPVYLDSKETEWILPEQYTWYKISDCPREIPKSPREGDLLAAFVRYNKPAAESEPSEIELIRTPAELAAKHQRDIAANLATATASRMEQQMRPSGTSNSWQAGLNAIAQTERDRISAAHRRRIDGRNASTETFNPNIPSLQQK